MTTDSTATAPSTAIGKLVATIADEINAEHRACLSAANDALDHAMRCGDLLSKGKATLPHGQWQQWLVENFVGSARTARLYMQLSGQRAELEAKRQRDTVLPVREARRLLTSQKPVVDPDDSIDQICKPDPTLVPPTECTLMISREARNGGCDIVWIEPSAAGGYFFVTIIRTAGVDCEGIAEGTKRPIADFGVRSTIKVLGVESVVQHGERYKLADVEPLRFNRWLYESYEHYLEQQRIDWHSPAALQHRPGEELIHGVVI